MTIQKIRIIAYYTFKEIQDYNPDDNLVASDAYISDDGDDF